MSDAARVRQCVELAAQRYDVVRQSLGLVAWAYRAAQPAVLGGDANRALAGVTYLRLEAADREHWLTRDVDHVGAERECEQRCLGKAELARADERHAVVDPMARKGCIDAREADLE